MDPNAQPGLAPPGLDLAPPATWIYSGPDSTRGFRLNRFALSLTKPENRARFIADEDAYMAACELGDAERALVRARDWTGLLRAGGHLQAMLKLAATLGLNLYDIGAHNTGLDARALYGLCPRPASGVPAPPPPERR